MKQTQTLILRSRTKVCVSKDGEGRRADPQRQTEVEPGFNIQTRTLVRAGLAGAGLAMIGLFAFAAFHPSAEGLRARIFHPDLATTNVAVEASQALAAKKSAYYRARTPQTANAYAAALLSAGRYDLLAALLDDPSAPFRTSVERSALAAEAALRRGLYTDAGAAADAVRAAARAPETGQVDRGVNAYADFLEARARYGADPREGAEAAALLAAPIRAGGDIAREAWFLKARIALDSGDTEYAALAARRAADAGADARRVQAITIEADIRRGALDDAAAALQQRLSENVAARRARTVDARVVNSGVDPEATRLSGLLALREGRFRDAARAFKSLGGALASEPRGRLYLALASLGAGDTASAAYAVALHRAAAPNDWTGRDLAVLVSHMRGDVDGAEEAAAALKALNPGLARLRAVQTDASDPTAYFEAMAAFANDDGSSRFVNAQVFLTGAELITIPELTAIASVHRRRALALASASDASSRAAQRTLRATLTEVFDGNARMVRGEARAALLALAGVALETAGAPDAAGDYYRRSLKAAPAFAPAVLRLAQLPEEAGHSDAALAAGRRYLVIAEGAPEQYEAAVRRALAENLTRRGFPQAALLALRPAEGALAGDPTTALDYAERLAAEGDQKRLIAFAAKAADIAPAGVVKGRLFAFAENQEQAARAFRAVLAAEPLNAVASEGYRAAMGKLGRTREAEALLNHIAARYGVASPVPARSEAIGEKHSLSARMVQNAAPKAGAAIGETPYAGVRLRYSGDALSGVAGSVKKDD